MPKLKTHKGAKARFKVTATGKILRTKHGKSHLRRNKPKRVKRQYDSLLPLSPKDRVRVSRLIPYGA
ncbi:MAG: 50S ribosomal protein L35 [Chloroflexi bacterium]|nr:50S ribosomal protein L35 [Chloroflexota bacterium]